MNDIDRMPVKCRDCAYWELAKYPWYCEDCTNRMKKPVGDFVSRQWLIDEYYRRHEGPPGGALQMIEEAPAADVEPKRRWIPVTERLPEEPGEYIVAYHPCHWDIVGPSVKVGIDSFRGKTTWAKNKYQRVIAWQENAIPKEEN